MLQRYPENTDDSHRYSVMVAVRDVADLSLITLACRLARARRGKICVLTVASSDVQPAWLKLPESCEDIPIDIVIRSDTDISSAILHEVQRRDTDTLILGWEGRLGQDLHVLGRTLDPVIQRAACDIIVMRGECTEDVRRVLIPAAGGPNAPEAFGLARALIPEAELTTLYVALERLGPAEVLVG